MILEYLIYAAVGRVAIFFLQRFPFHSIPKVGRLFEEGKPLHGLFACDLCLGFWVYTILSYMMQINILEGWFRYIPLISEVITGAVTSLLAHLIRIGWQTEYAEITIKAE